MCTEPTHILYSFQKNNILQLRGSSQSTKFLKTDEAFWEGLGGKHEVFFILLMFTLKLVYVTS